MLNRKNLLSVIILTHNSEKTIKKALESVKNLTSELLIIDDISSDRTLNIVKKFKVKIYKRQLLGDYSAQRNYAITKTKSEWILFLDSDEIVNKDLANEIKVKIRSTLFNGFLLKRDDYIWGRKLSFGESASVKLLRLARNRKGKWKRKVHEYWDVKGEIGELNNPIIHYPHPTVFKFVDNINAYSTLHAEENRKSSKKSSLLKIVFWPCGKFINNWILKLGFLDGTRGFVYAVLMSFHSFLAWSNLWLNQEKN